VTRQNFLLRHEVPPMDKAYWRRSGKVIAEAAGKKPLSRRAKRKE
jgi:hypothetical protein